MDDDPENLNQLPKLEFLSSREAYDKLFNEIIGIPADESPSEIIKQVKKKLNPSLTLALKISPTSANELILYRLRVSNDKELPIDESSPTAFTYPPLEGCTNFKRMSYPGEQVFYASGDAHTTFHELIEDIQVGSSVAYLSKWGLKPLPEETLILSLCYGVNKNPEESYSGIIAKRLDELYNNMSKDLIPQYREMFLYYQKKYVELFTHSGTSRYHISAAIAHDYLNNFKHKEADIPILMYPSVAKKLGSLNFVIRKNFADEFLYLKEVDKIVITEIHEKANSYKLISRGIPDSNGIIKWYKLKFGIWQNEDKPILASYDENDPILTELSPDEILCNNVGLFGICISDFLHRNKFYDVIIPEMAKNLNLPTPEILEKQRINVHSRLKIDGDVYIKSKLYEKRAIKFLSVPLIIDFIFE